VRVFLWTGCETPPPSLTQQGARLLVCTFGSQWGLSYLVTNYDLEPVGYVVQWYVGLPSKRKVTGSNPAVSAFF